MATSGSKQVVVEPVAQGSAELRQVKVIWRRNSETLGFLTDGAFRERAEKKQILGARVDENVAGYLVFFRNRRHEIRITHLCVDEGYRGRGIASRLIESLVARAKNASRIRLWCRRDFPAWHLWHRLGFVAFREKPGKKASGSRLTEFRRELDPMPLFAALATDEASLKIAVDANVYLDLVRPERPQHAESSGLLEDWLAAETQLCITDELFNDIRRGPDQSEQEALVREAQRWERICAKDSDRTVAERLVSQVLGLPTTAQDLSDRRHLAYAIAGGADAFATRDLQILAKRDEIYDSTGLLVGRPADLITEYDVLINERDYQERELKGSGVVRTHLTDASQFRFEPFIDPRKDEKPASFRASVNAAIAHPATHEVRQVSDKKGQPLAFYVVEKCDEITASLARFRLDRAIVDTRLGRSLVRFLLADIQRQSASFGAAVYRFDDVVATEQFSDALRDLGFLSCGGKWWKLCLPGIWSADGIRRRLTELAKQRFLPEELATGLIANLNAAIKAQEASKLLEFEHHIWPGKVVAEFVESYVIPIDPRWAADLFDIDLRNRPLLDDETDLLLNPESAYYKAASGPPTVDCGRILWYVSQDDNWPGSRRIRACSRMTERVIGPAITTYRRFRHLGVYQWRDVRQKARGSERPIMGIGFTDTEPLSHPMSFQEANLILERYGQRSQFQTATRISDEAFFAIYQHASGLNSKPQGQGV
ncbi:MAG: GNAT family N-acetyltransferase [Pirellulaceae bacterium]|nr:GNAT family N-acetyltransferase [Pirellulaceae bacterium]